MRVVLEVSARRDANKMGLRNLTLVLAPNLVVPAQRTSSAGKRGSGREVFYKVRVVFVTFFVAKTRFFERAQKSVFC